MIKINILSLKPDVFLNLYIALGLVGAYPFILA